MTNEQIIEVFKEAGALLKGHFKLTSGLHSDTYIQCARVLEHPRITNELAAEAVKRLPEGLEIDLVAAPAVGGILYGYALATALDRDLIFSERVEGKMTLRRSFVIPEGARVLVAEDVVTTGGSVKELLELVKQAGAEVVAVLSMVDRGKNPNFGSPYYPLICIETPSWEQKDCYLCESGEIFSTLGSRELAKNVTNP